MGCLGIAGSEGLFWIPLFWTVGASTLDRSWVEGRETDGVIGVTAYQIGLLFWRPSNFGAWFFFTVLTLFTLHCNYTTHIVLGTLLAIDHNRVAVGMGL